MTSRERLAAAGRHLDQRAGAVLGQRIFEVGDRLDLRLPQALGRQLRHGPQIGAKLVVELRQADQFLGAVEGEDLAAAGWGSSASVNCVTAPVDS